MTRTKKNAINVKNSNVNANDVNVVANEVVNEVANEKEKKASSAILPLRESSVLVDEIEYGEKETAKKKESMDLIINHFRAPIPSALVLFGRFFRAGCPCDSDVVKKVVYESGLAPESDDAAVASWVLGLDAPSAGAFTRAANAWWRIAGDFVEASLDDVIEYANKHTTLANDVYFCGLKKHWFFIDDTFVIFSASNNDGKKMMFAPGCYYQVAERTTANYIRAIRSIGVFLDAKRREMKGKVSNVFALRPAVTEYLYRVLSAGFLKAADIADIAKEVEKRIEEEGANEKARYLQTIDASEFTISELTREIENTKALLSGAGISESKRKKLSSKLKGLDQKVSAAKTSLSVAKMSLADLAK